LIDHVALTYESAGQRVAAILDRLARTIGSGCNEGIAVDVTNEELANAANNKRQSSGHFVMRLA